VYTDIDSWPRQDFLPAQVRFFHDYLNIFLHFGTVTPRARRPAEKEKRFWQNVFEVSRAPFGSHTLSCASIRRHNIFDDIL
jgi:hypothetical protein